MYVKVAIDNLRYLPFQKFKHKIAFVLCDDFNKQDNKCGVNGNMCDINHGTIGELSAVVIDSYNITDNIKSSILDHFKPKLIHS